MALQVCKACTTRYAPAGECPHCGANEWVSELEADEQGGQVAPGTGEPMVGIEHPADGTLSPPVSNDDGPVDYESLPVAVLRELARDRGITQHGVLKADLVTALAQWDAEHPAGDGVGDDSISGD